MSLCGLHRRLRGAIVGHLALFEMTSSIPNRRYASGLRRLGIDDPAATAFFDEHVEADAVHEAIAAVDLAGGLARAEPELAPDILWGARALLAVERRWADSLLDAWERGESSLARRGYSRAASAPLGALKRTSLCVPSQNGRRRDLPQRQSATVSRRDSISRPSWSSIRNGPRTSSGPSRYGRDRDVVGHRSRRYPLLAALRRRARRGRAGIPCRSSARGFALTNRLGAGDRRARPRTRPTARRARRAVGVGGDHVGRAARSSSMPHVARRVPWRPVSDEPLTCSRAPARRSAAIAPPATPSARRSAPGGRSASRTRARAPRRSPRGTRPRRRRTTAPRAAPSGAPAGPWAIASSARSPSTGTSSCASSAPVRTSSGTPAAPSAPATSSTRSGSSSRIPRRSRSRTCGVDRDQRRAVGDGEPRQLDRLVDVGRPVVDARQQVEVELVRCTPSTVTHGPDGNPNLATTCQGSLASAGMRDYLAATRERVVVFDGGMGATLEQFDLSLEHDYKLPGRAHEALVLNRPDVIGRPARVDGRGRRGGRRDRHVPGVADQARRVGPAATTRYEINRKAAEIARAAIGEQRFVAGSIGPTGHLPASDDPTLGKITFRELVARLRRSRRKRPRRRRRRPADHRDRAGHPRGQGRDLRRARGVRAGRPRGADPDVGLAAAQRRQDAARHRHRRRARDARGARRRRHRPELLDRPRGHARRDPLPRRALARAGPLHPERRHPAPGPERRDDLPRGAPTRSRTRSASSSSATASSIVGGCCGTTPEHIARDRRARRRPHARRARPRRAPPHVSLDDGRDAARAGPGADAGRRARQLAGLAQGQGAAAGRRLRRHSSRSPRTRSRAARTCSTSASR